jgi:hypothetical protein
MPQTDIAEVVSFFNNEFIPAYSDLTGFIVNKPQEILIGIEYAFSHLMQHFNEELGTESQDKNLEKAYHHLQRATLDCYKLLWVYMNTNIVQLIDNQSELPPACAGGFLRVSGDHGDPRTCLSQITSELPVARPQGIL